MSKFHTERVTKIDAVRRQLRTAIRLFFDDGDIVSIHTLTAAVQELLRGLLKSKGDGSFIKDSDLVRPEYIAEYMNIINRPQNFFKHADKDPDEILEFHPEVTPFWILDCVQMYSKLTGRMLRESKVFLLWFMVKHPKFLKPGKESKIIQEAIQAGPPTKDMFRQMLYRADLFPMPDVD